MERLKRYPQIVKSAARGTDDDPDLNAVPTVPKSGRPIFTGA